MVTGANGAPDALDRPATHRSPSRGQFRSGQSSVPESPVHAGRFGRMFPNLPSFAPDDAQLQELAATMAETESADNDAIEAGFTYLGQFIDHDLTFDTASSLERQNDPDALVSFRTPGFDLDSVYGRGPDDQPYLYQRDRTRFAIGEGNAAPTQRTDGEARPELDLPRLPHDTVLGASRTAVIGDPRNDENLLVAQVHLAFLLFHNRLADSLDGVGVDLSMHRWADGSTFHEAQRLARWHYQWIVLTEFLPRICDADVLRLYVHEAALPSGAVCRAIGDLRYYRPGKAPFIPVEWSVAAYRFGHSLIRERYALNDALTSVAGEIPIFIAEEPTPQNRLKHLAGGSSLPQLWSLDWRRFFRHQESGVVPQPARLIDAKLAGGLGGLPGIVNGSRSLAVRNLKRGKAMGLPSGQAVARRLCVDPLPPMAPGGEDPLWHYILREADEQGRGEHLGVVGSTIVAETMLGFLASDPFCFLNVDPTWQPVVPRRPDSTDERWGMADLLAFAVPDDGRTLQAPGGGQPPPPRYS